MKQFRIILLVLLVLGVGVTLFVIKNQQKSTPPIVVQKMDWKKSADDFLKNYLVEYEKVYDQGTSSYWQASNSGKKEDFEAYAQSDLKIKNLHRNPDKFKQLAEILQHEKELDPLTARSLRVAYLNFQGNQLPQELLNQLVTTATSIEQGFTSFRGKIDGQEYSDNELKEMLKKETNSAKREKIWGALKEVGNFVAPRLIGLAKIRNEAAVKLGYKNFWEMQIKLQEHDPEKLTAIFAELEKMTAEPFKKVKEQIDTETAARLKINPREVMPWHYDNPFFQEPPPSNKIDLDDFYRNKKKEQIVEIAQSFYKGIGLPIDRIVQNSDLYERPGKQQHAFCTDMNHNGDVRSLLNVKAESYWMDTVLHEMGHGVYAANLDFNLPFNLRDSANSLTTEAVAMLFGALSKNPKWIASNLAVEQEKVARKKNLILEQRRREQLLFARWSLVMMNFEKSLYENPEQDLNALWWNMVERYQLMKKPSGRNAADWAAKIHFTMVPVYYHNYMLGELFAAQLRSTLQKVSGSNDPEQPVNYEDAKLGEFLREKVFKPGMTMPWPELVQSATSEPLTAKYFASELI